MFELDRNRRPGNKLFPAQHSAPTHDVNFACVRDFHGKHKGQTDFGIHFHAVAGPEQNTAKRQVLGDCCCVSRTRRTSQGYDLLDGDARVLAAVRSGVHCEINTREMLNPGP